MKTKAENFQSRWGDPELDDPGYITIPGFIMRNYAKFVYAGHDPQKQGNVVGLLADEFVVLSHIMAFKYDVAGSEAKPSLATVAAQTGRHITNIRRTVKRMEEKGIVKVTPVAGQPNIYDFGELVRQCRQYERTPSVHTRGSVDASTSADAHTTPSVYASTPLAYTLVEEYKEEIEDQDIPQSDKAPIECAPPQASESTDDPTPVPMPKPRKPKADAIPKALMDPMKDAIAASFGWDWKTMTESEIGTVQKTARQLCKVGVSPAEVPAIFAYCNANYDQFGPGALASNLTKSRQHNGKLTAPLAPITVTHPDPNCVRCDGLGYLYPENIRGELDTSCKVPCSACLEKERQNGQRAQLAS